MQHADQREQAAGGGEIGLDLPLEPLHEQFGGLIVDAAAGHVDGLDLRRGGLADGLVIAVADREIFADQAAESLAQIAGFNLGRGSLLGLLLGGGGGSLLGLFLGFALGLLFGFLLGCSVLV